MTQEDFVTEFTEIVEADPGSIAFDTPLNDVKTWDSLSQVSFLAMVDERFGKSISSDDLDAAKTVSDLWALAAA